MHVDLQGAVGDAMLRRPRTTGMATTVGHARDFFRNDHVHALLVVAGRRLVAVVERADLTDAHDSAPAWSVGTLTGRTVTQEVGTEETKAAMRAAGRRRFAVVAPDGTLLGLLCLKRSGSGFCSDDDVRARALDPH
jgi:CBS-domain-containing membrane protein